MINNPTDVLNLKSLFERDLISREEYWTGIEGYLSIVRNLRFYVRGKVNCIEINDKNLSIIYNLDSSNSLKLLVPENDLRTASFTVLLNGNYENLLEEILFLLFKESAHFIDIGANIGFYSISSSILNPTLKCTAFEPNPRIKRVFSNNIAINNLDNITVHELALSNYSGQADFYIPAFTGSGGGSFQILHPEEGEPITYKVGVKTLDEIVKDNSGIDLIKIDVEGSEYQVILGALNTIKNFKPTIVVELLRKWMRPFESSPQMVLDHLSSLGYSCFAVSNDSIRKVNKIDDLTTETNFIFSHSNNESHNLILSRFYK
jgi:FkbM family methyltransferase